MSTGIDDLDFDSPTNGEQEKSVEEQTFGAENNFSKPWLGDNLPQETNNNEPSDNSEGTVQNVDIITDLLKAKGIKDPAQIKFVEDNGEITSKPWEQLTREEQLNILNTPQENQADDLDDDEIELINQLRLSKMTPEEFIEKTKQDGIQEYSSNTPIERTYTVDDISDDELYVYDLKARSKDITDEELATALEKAKEDPDLYSKQMAGIRAEYKQLEDDDIAQKQAIETQEQQERLEAFQNDISQAILDMDSVGSLDISLDDDDREELAEFILGTDQAGNSYLGKALNDPETLTRMAWFALKGADALDEIQDYFTQQITNVRQQAYQQGLEDSKKGTAHVVIQKTEENKEENTNIPQFQNSSITDISQLD